MMSQARKAEKRHVNHEEKHFSNQFGYPTTFANELHSRARKAADFILDGGREDADKLIMLVRDNPGIKTIEMEVKDTHGNTIKGTLPRIATIVGEVSAVTGEIGEVPPLIHDVKHCGFLEMLLSEGEPLPPEEINQLEKIGIIRDYQDNKAPNELQKLGIPNSEQDAEHTIKMSMATIQFGEGILSSASKYQKVKAIFNAAFSPRTIISGFAFDIKILCNAAQWFYQNQQRFNDEQTLLFWEDGFNQLLNHMSTRDKQLFQNYIFSDDGLLEYQFEPMSKGQEIKASDIPNGKIYLAPGGSYILRNVDGEIHKGKIEFVFRDRIGSFDRIADEQRLLITLGQNLDKKQMLTLISQNGHVQLTPKTTPSRSLNKKEIFSPIENLLFLFGPYHRAMLAENPSQLARYLKKHSIIIAHNFYEHRSKKDINYVYAIQRAKEATPAPKSNVCAIQ